MREGPLAHEFYSLWLDATEAGRPPGMKVTPFLDLSIGEQNEWAVLAEVARRLAAPVAAEELWHYWRECHHCGYAGADYLHCLHDGIQSYCTQCGVMLASFPGAECNCEFHDAVASRGGDK